jgi:hypothetical protein
MFQPYLAFKLWIIHDYPIAFILGCSASKMGFGFLFFDPRNDVILYTETQISWTRTPLLRRCEKNWWFGKHDDEELRVKPRKSYDQWSFNCHCWLCIWIYITHIWDCWVFVKVYIIYPFMYHIQVNTCVPFNCFIAILKSRKGPAGVAWSGSRNRCRVPCRRDSDGSDDPKSVFLGLHKMVPPR